jgi:hypothetical protein
MVHTMKPTSQVRLFVDDGYPEAREYDDNYVEVRMAADALRLPSGEWVTIASRASESNTAMPRWIARICRRIRSNFFGTGSRLQNKPA